MVSVMFAGAPDVWLVWSTVSQLLGSSSKLEKYKWILSCMYIWNIWVVCYSFLVIILSFWFLLIYYDSHSKIFLMNIVYNLLFQISFYLVLTPDAGLYLFVIIVRSVFVLYRMNAYTQEQAANAAALTEPSQKTPPFPGS